MAEQKMMFDNMDDFEEIRREWKGMPEFLQEDWEPNQKITISFREYDDVRKFGALIGQTVTPKTNSLWFPKPNVIAPKNLIYTDE
tara:strand:+ start:2389 stop:2643 length:255 start_codon:yes stop_codon:yes gene_type:complete